jgi:hypothetical protein
MVRFAVRSIVDDVRTSIACHTRLPGFALDDPAGLVERRALC